MFFLKIANIYEERIHEKLKIMQANFSNGFVSVQPDFDILLDSRFFTRSYLEMHVMRLDETDYFFFNDLRNCFCVNMLSIPLLRVFCGDILERLHYFAFCSMDHSVRFAIECLEVIHNDIYFPLKREIVLDASTAYRKHK